MTMMHQNPNHKHQSYSNVESNIQVVPSNMYSPPASRASCFVTDTGVNNNIIASPWRCFLHCLAFILTYKEKHELQGEWRVGRNMSNSLSVFSINKKASGSDAEVYDLFDTILAGLRTCSLRCKGLLRQSKWVTFGTCRRKQRLHRIEDDC